MKSIPRGTRKISKELFDQIIEWRKKGWSYELISRTTGISRSTIFNYVKGAQAPYTTEEILIINQKGR